MLTSILLKLKEIPGKILDFLKVFVGFLRENSIYIKISKKTTSEVSREIEINNTFIVLIIISIVGIIYFLLG